MIQKQYGCPVEVTLDIIGGKWKCVILWWLRRGEKRFGELKQLMPGVSQKVLAGQLRELEADRLISRQVFQESPPRVEYALTAYGETLRPITELMCNWGKAHAPEFQFGLMCLRGLRILVIADDMIRQRLEAELGDLRGANITAVPLAIALQTFDQINPAIVLIDFGLDQDFEPLQPLLKQADPALTIPAIALTATVQDLDRALMQGFGVHLMEPVEISELVAAIATLTGRLEDQP
jgi:DNA-binding HxlR family transcriptional regulator/CheY-like chemotaxis protein